MFFFFFCCKNNHFLSQHKKISSIYALRAVITRH